MKQIFSKIMAVLLFSVFTVVVQAQDNLKTVSGNVVDSDGEPLVGVTVRVDGTDRGTITDVEGYYELQAAQNEYLSFTFIGMHTVQKQFAEDDSIDAVMVLDNNQLEDVVVVGYGEQKREHITSAIETVKIDEIEDLPVGNLSSALVGRVLGVSVSGGERRPGEGARIVIRNPMPNLSKDGGSDSPLYVIDGIIQVDADTGLNDNTYFNTLDATEVESISFLKDAAAAIYGARAANGVVVVQTKRGQKGPARVSYSGNLSIADEIYRVEMMDAYEYGLTRNIMNGPNGAGQEFDPNNPTPNGDYFFSPSELDHFRTLNHDFLDDNWTSAVTQRHNLNVSGGGDFGTYFGGISYFEQEGNLGTVNFDKWSFRAGSNVDITDGVKASFQVSGFYNQRGTTYADDDARGDDYGSLQNRPPYIPMYVGGLPFILEDADDLGIHFEEIERLQNLTTNNGNNVTVNANVDYEVPFIDGLKLQARFSRTETKDRGTQTGFRYPLYTFDGVDAVNNYVFYESGSGPLGENVQNNEIEIKNGDRILTDNSTRKRIQGNFTTSYGNSFGKNNLSALFSIEKSRSDHFKDRMMIENNVPLWSTGMFWQVPQDDADYSNTFNWRDEAGDLGYIGRLNYNFDEKYFGEFLFRADASTKFHPDNYWGGFYSLSGGWILSKENWFQSNLFDYLKLRGSVGLLGNDNVRQWRWLQTFGYSVDRGAVFGGDNNISPGMRASAAANESIRWSDERKYNLGIETRLLDNRLTASIDQYYNQGFNQLIDLTQGVPWTVGGGSTPLNYGESDIWGTEIGLDWSENIGSDINYGITLNTGWNNDKVVRGDFTAGEFYRPWETQPGESRDRGTWGYDYMGMFKNQQDIDNYVNQTGVTQMFNVSASEFKPGMLYYRDIRGMWDPATGTFAAPDGIIDENDRIQLKERQKGLTGFASTLRFKFRKLSLNSVLTANWGGYNVVEARDTFNENELSQLAENRPAFWADMFDPELNPDGTVPNMSREHGDVSSALSEFWHVNDFNIAVRNINISYSLPQKWVDKLNVSTMKFNLISMNPFILHNPFSDYGLGPDGNYGRYPTMKTHSLGFNLGF